jgi:hypothetical protein
MKSIATLIISAVIVAFASLAWGASPTNAKTVQGVDLARLNSWNIVVADDAIASETYAAEEFQEFLRQASGVKLPIVHKITRQDKNVFIGPGKVMQANRVGFSVDDLGPEDLHIVVRDDNIAIAGGRPRGTLYGVYTFLEDYLGVRFLTNDHTHVPPVGDWRVVGPVDRIYHPPLRYRFANYGENVRYPAFAVKLRCNGVNNQYAERNYNYGPITEDPRFGEPTGLIHINHSLHTYVPQDKYVKEHPEYYAMIDGERMGGKGRAQLCFTNPGVFKVVVQGVLRELELFPDRTLVSVSQHDGGSNYCRCEKCAAINKREESHMGALLTLVNAVADEIGKKHPDVMVGTLAYNWSLKAPKNLKPRPNVLIQLSSVPCSPLYPIGDQSCTQNEGFRRVLSDWGRICENISIWNYNLNHWNIQLPNPNMRVVEPNIRYFVANNARGVFMQSPDGLATEFSELKNYITSSLLWDPNRSGEKLRDEFIDLHYGRAAGTICEYIDFLHDTVRINTKSKPWVSFCGWRENFGIDDELVQTGMKLFEEALRLADNDNEVVRSRVEKASICIYSAAVEPAYQWGHTAFYDGKGEYDTRPIDPSLAPTRPYARKFFELCNKYGVNLWSEGHDLKTAREYIRRAYGLKKDEPL